MHWREQLPLCCKTWWRGFDLWLTWELHPNHWRLLTPSLLGMYVLPTNPAVGANVKGQPRESNVWLRSSGQHVWLNPFKSFYQLLRLWWAGVEIYWSCGGLRQAHREVPLLVNPAAYQSEVVSLFPGFSIPFKGKGQGSFRFLLGNSPDCEPTLSVLV